MTAIRPDRCPFCQSLQTNSFECDVGEWAVACAACGAIGPAADAEATAIQRWNAARHAEGAAGLPRIGPLQ